MKNLHIEDQIKRLLAEDKPEAMQVIFDNLYKPLCICTMRYVSDMIDAEDIVQDVLTSFWINKRGKEFEGSVRAYLFTATSRAAHKNVSRKRTIRFGDVEAFLDEQFEKLMEQADDERVLLKKILDANIAKLPLRSREVFKLVTTTNMSYREVGDKLGVTVNTVKTLYYNAIKKLRENINDDKLFVMIILTAFFLK